MAVAMRTRCKRQVDSRVTAGDRDAVMIPCRTAGRHSPVVLDAHSMTVAYSVVFFTQVFVLHAPTTVWRWVSPCFATYKQHGLDQTGTGRPPLVFLLLLTFNVWLHYFLFPLL